MAASVKGKWIKSYTLQSFVYIAVQKIILQTAQIAQNWSNASFEQQKGLI